MADAEGTRQRILAAAADEFAEKGIAGARVDRIAERSGASKPMLYAYFGSKDRLFDAVFESRVIANSTRAPFTPDDLPGYAARLYDDYLLDPQLVRLVVWKRMERLPDGYLYGGLESVDAEHLDAIRERQSKGTIRDDLTPEDVWSLLIATAATWAQSSLTDVARADDPTAHHRRRRSALARVVRSGLCTTSG